MTEQASPTASIIDTVRALAEGDMVRVSYGRNSQAKTRTVRVTSVTADGKSVLTTSGKSTHCNHVSGGAFYLWDAESVLFQATMNQQVRYVTSIEVLGKAN